MRGESTLDGTLDGRTSSDNLAPKPEEATMTSYRFDTKFSSYQVGSFFSSVVERGIAALQIILRSLFRSREGADFFCLISVLPDIRLFIFAFCTCSGKLHEKAKDTIKMR